MNLIIDIGNTKIKFALFKGQTLLIKGKGNSKDLEEFVQKNKITKVLISSVTEHKEVEEILRYNKISFSHLSHTTSLPIVNKYKTPQTLGDDRLANVVGANYLYPKNNVLTIDAGTCIKFDAITKSGEYFGGAISPGLEMRFKALNHYTGKLPLVKPRNLINLIGNSSNESILSGVINGMIAEINGIIAQYEEVYEKLTVILTGGDASFFDKELKSNIFVESNLTLIGLNEILLYNARL